MNPSRPIFVIQLMVAAALVVGTFSQVNAEVIRLSEPVSKDASSETFGAEIAKDSEVLNLEQILLQPAQYSGRSVVIRARVDKVCQKKGCFFIARDGDAMVRVAFKDYGFFVPTDIAGREVTLAGKLIKRQLSTDQADHYMADLGGSGQPIEAGLVYEIVASAVRVPVSVGG